MNRGPEENRHDDERSFERPDERPFERPDERLGDQADDRADERAVEPYDERPVEPYDERPDDWPAERPAEAEVARDAVGQPRPPREPVTPALSHLKGAGPVAPHPARTVRLVSGDFLLTVNPVDGTEIEPCP
ncbi:hypothetical protein, partial [Streptomyces sp. AcH 505]|uniref:hypothetical protein n=1 Tax=Streptomyces sp. AcH 505 TaxID=352211 RepID=UPI001F516871